MRGLLIALGIAAAIACVAAANVVLLGYGIERHDPVGQLDPVAPLAGAPRVAPPARTRPEHGGEGRDD